MGGSRCLFCLPSYNDIYHFVVVAIFAGAELVSFDVSFLQQAEALSPGSVAFIISQTKAAGLVVTGYTAADAAGFNFLAGLGVDWIFIGDVPVGVLLQAPWVE